MIRIIARWVNAGAAANVGGPVDEGYRTFDVDIPELEYFLRELSTYDKSVIGVELVTQGEQRIDQKGEG